MASRIALCERVTREHRPPLSFQNALNSLVRKIWSAQITVEGATSKSGDVSFIEALMEQIMSLAMIPKVQVERAIGPILGIFIEDLLSKSDDRLKKICAEFPLRKRLESYHSTKVDWLLYSSKSEQLVFVELKTTDTTFDLAQAKIHLAAIKKIKENGWSLLVKDVEDIGCKSLEQGKYREVLTVSSVATNAKTRGSFTLYRR